MASPAAARHQILSPVDGIFSKHQCSRCSRAFKRLEHLKRHQRGHEEQNRLSCSICSKTFTRSDIRNRHEALHAQDQQASPDRRRACFECARIRGRCNKADPCIRCSMKSLTCVYPRERPAQQRRRAPVSTTVERTRQAALPSPDPTPVAQQAFLGPPKSLSQNTEHHQLLLPRTEIRDVLPGLEEPGGIIAGRQSTNQDEGKGGLSSEFQPQHSGSPPTSQADVGAATFTRYMNDADAIDLPINWLPADYSMDVDYSSLLGLGMGGPGLLTAPASDWERSLGGDASALPASALETDVQQPQQINQPDYAFTTGTPRLMDLAPVSPSRDQQDNKSTPGSYTSITGTVSTASRISVESNSPRLLAHGGIYATSTNGSRIPCTARTKKSAMIIWGSTQIPPVSEDMPALPGDDHDQDSLEFPDLSCLSCPPFERGSHPKGIDTDTYSVIASHFRRLCLDSNGFYPVYATHEFPSSGYLNFFIHLFFENFDPILPVYNAKVTNLNKHWILALAVAAIGSHYTETEEFSQCIIPIHEFLRRALAVEFETADLSPSSLPLIQAMLLSQLGMMYYGSRRLRSLAKARRSILADAATSMRLLGPDIHTEGVLTGHVQRSSPISGPSLEASWRQWLLEEARRRLGYAIWLMDCMSVYHFRLRPLLSLESAQCELPHDELWSAQTAEEWSRKYKCRERNPSLALAVHKLFLERQMKADLGEYSNLLLLHGVYQEVFKVKDYFNRELSTWTPSVPELNDAGTSGLETGNASALGRRSTFESWRSAAMDCVDVLHWSANGVVAQLLGAEHATVLHLQFSRVVLWSPYEKVQEIAAYLASLTERSELQDSGGASMEAAIQAESEVLQWAQMDEHKARLAALHCGCFFWHVRRYSCKAFYEPASVFLATLVLWAYSVYASRAPLPCRLGDEEEDLNGTPNPTFIHLDRPCDDEMVQLFVRSGRPCIMRAYVAGVGNIYDPNGPAGILREGRKLLVAVSTAWGRTAEYIKLIRAVEKYTLECRTRASAFLHRPLDNENLDGTPLATDS